MNILTPVDWSKTATILGVAAMVISAIKDSLAERKKEGELTDKVRSLEAKIDLLTVARASSEKKDE